MGMFEFCMKWKKDVRGKKKVLRVLKRDKQK